MSEKAILRITDTIAAAVAPDGGDFSLVDWNSDWAVFSVYHDGDEDYTVTGRIYLHGDTITMHHESAGPVVANVVADTATGRAALATRIAIDCLVILAR